MHMMNKTMPRNRPSARPLSEVCSDCGAADTNWASVNRGILMCNDCASVHMSMGRHISQVKHLHKSQCHLSLLNMVQHLVNVGANSIWEHSLLDPAQTRSGKRKPNPSDHTHPTKSEFIRTKYLNLAYVHKPPCRDDDNHDISKQLHSSVRTGNLETSLRLLSQGAQANYFNTEKGNTPLHVAAKVGQSSQVELLVAYGADPAAHDNNGKTAEDLARAENHNELADRLIQLQFELSDRLTHFVCGMIPDHKTGKHYIIPKSKDVGPASIEGRRRLQSLNNQTFEELAMDVFDEVDRRELEVIWQETQKVILIPGKGTNPALQTEVVPFLPVNPDYSPTRNQGRQKLAVFKDSEFHSLITDIIIEIVRRQGLYDQLPKLNEEDPIYDVPPDEDLDFLSIEKSATTIPQKEMVLKEDFVALQQKLNEREAYCAKLQELNRELSEKVTTLAKQKHNLTKKVQSLIMSQPQTTLTNKSGAPCDFLTAARLGPGSPGGRPSSVYNPNDSSGSQSSLHSGDSLEHRRKTFHVATHQTGAAAASAEELRQTFNMAFNINEEERAGNASHCSNGSDYDNNGNKEEEEEAGKDNTTAAATTNEPAATTGSTEETEMPQNNMNANNNLPGIALKTASEAAGNESPTSDTAEGDRSGSSSPHSQLDSEEGVTWPERNSLMRRTDLLTRNIQTLLQTAQIKKTDCYLECAENILSAVNEVVVLFEKPFPGIKSILQLISESAHKLRNRCKETAEQKSKAENHKQLTEEIIAYAYEIAKAEKDLVTRAPKEDRESSSSSS